MICEGTTLLSGGIPSVRQKRLGQIRWESTGIKGLEKAEKKVGMLNPRLKTIYAR